MHVATAYCNNELTGGIEGGHGVLPTQVFVPILCMYIHCIINI